MMLAASTLSVAAWASLPLPWKSPPIRTLPPPVAPDASMLDALTTIAAPVIVTAPPLPVRLAVEIFAPSSLTWAPPMRTLLPAAAMVPDTATVPPAPPPSTIAPSRPDTELALIEPGMLMALRTASRAVAARNSTRPPLARILPLLETSASPSASVAPVGTATCKNLSPLTSSVARSPDPRPILPMGAEITPEFDTWPPRRPTKPPDSVAMRPALPTEAEVPLPLNVLLPAMKSALDVSSDEPTKPRPTLIVPVAVIWMPFGLTR